MNARGFFRENYKGPLMGRTDEVKLAEEDFVGSPKPGNTGQGREGSASYVTRGLETDLV